MNIVIATDFSVNSQIAIEFGIALAELKGAHITLVHAIERVLDPLLQGPPSYDKSHLEAEQFMTQLIAKYQNPTLQFEYVVSEGSASTLVSKVADRLKATLVITGTQGQSGILKTLIGSTSINLIKNSKVPVLVVPSQSKASLINKIVLALAFTAHERKFIDWAVDMSSRWDKKLEFVHVQVKNEYEEELELKKLEEYIQAHHQGFPIKLHTFYAATPVEGLNQFLEENEHVILVMCHEHQNFLQQILNKSQTIEMLFHTKTPMLVMPQSLAN